VFVCIYWFCVKCSIIHLAVCLTTRPKPLPKRALQLVLSRASSFKWEYHLTPLRSSSSFLCLLPRLPVTSIRRFIFPSIIRCRRQFLCKMWPIQLAFRLHISCRIFLCSLTLSNTFSFLTWSCEKCEMLPYIKNRIPNNVRKMAERPAKEEKQFVLGRISLFIT
jgi:hypothetical protein